MRLFQPASPGAKEAARRITAARNTRSDELDLDGLGLTELPPSLAPSPASGGSA